MQLPPDTDRSIVLAGENWNMATAKKAVASTTAPVKAAAAGRRRQRAPNAAFMKAMNPSAALRLP